LNFSGSGNNFGSFKNFTKTKINNSVWRAPKNKNKYPGLGGPGQTLEDIILYHYITFSRILIFLAASTECSAGSNDHFVVGVGVGGGGVG
jgi:hypothetical protein